MPLHDQYDHGMSCSVYKGGIDVVADHDGHDPDEISHDSKLVSIVAQKGETISVTGLKNKNPRVETYPMTSMAGP